MRIGLLIATTIAIAGCSQEAQTADIGETQCILAAGEKLPIMRELRLVSPRAVRRPVPPSEVGKSRMEILLSKFPQDPDAVEQIKSKYGYTWEVNSAMSRFKDDPVAQRNALREAVASTIDGEQNPLPPPPIYDVTFEMAFGDRKIHFRTQCTLDYRPTVENLELYEP